VPPPPPPPQKRRRRQHRWRLRLPGVPLRLPVLALRRPRRLVPLRPDEDEAVLGPIPPRPPPRLRRRTPNHPPPPPPQQQQHLPAMYCQLLLLQLHPRSWPPRYRRLPPDRVICTTTSATLAVLLIRSRRYRPSPGLRASPPPWRRRSSSRT